MNSTPRICPECGASFVPAYNHIYKVRYKGDFKPLCSYTCYRKAQAKNKHRDYASRGREFG